MANNKRSTIPLKLQKELMQEAGWRCASPSCRVANSLEMAHITPYKECKSHDFENMIILCANCHTLYDRQHVKTMTPELLRRIKDNLKILNGRYSQFEFRLLQYFSDNKDKSEILLLGREFDVMFLIKDGLLEESPEQYQNAINSPPKKYILTAAGANFIKRWVECDVINS